MARRKKAIIKKLRVGIDEAYTVLDIDRDSGNRDNIASTMNGIRRCKKELRVFKKTGELNSYYCDEEVFGF